MNKFVIIAPMFNASLTLERMLFSLYGQSYDSWRVILIDDVSSHDEQQKYDKIIEKFSAFDDKITLLTNREKKWEVFNVLSSLKTCNDDDIIVRLDADDWLVDLDAFAIMNQVYTSTDCEAAWSAHRWGFSDKNISSSMPDNVNPYKTPWVSSHMKTFRKKLINSVPYENFVNMNNELIKRCGDQAVYLPVLFKAQKKIFVPRVMYHYNIVDSPELYQSDDAKFQKAEADFIRQRGYVAMGTPWEILV